jgi:SAM-dependent methyltransferase
MGRERAMRHAPCAMRHAPCAMRHARTCGHASITRDGAPHARVRRRGAAYCLCVNTATEDYWNHNVHYQRVILDAVPERCGAAIDVGCGDGLLACRLAARCATVTGIDRDGPMVAAARERGRDVPGVSFVQADFLAYPLDDASFDFACANTALHHMDFGAALVKMARILRPGGRLAVVGLAANGSPADWVTGAAGIPANLWYKHTRGEGNPDAPIMEPEMTWSQVRSAAARLLPGARYRRHLLWRYSVTWVQPA